MPPALDPGPARAAAESRVVLAIITHPGQANGLALVGVCRRVGQHPGHGQVRQPFPGDGEADVQQHLMTDEHLRI